MQRHLITSAIPYINGVKHLGNLIGSQLPADLYARYQRGRGNEVLFLCATDEHGTPAELAAAKANQNISEYCKEMHEVQARLADGFCLSFDHFGRSSSRENHELTQHFAGQLEAAGLINEVNETQIYSHVDKRYLPDRYIEGTCPACGFEDARGDQCDVLIWRKFCHSYARYIYMCPSTFKCWENYVDALCPVSLLRILKHFPHVVGITDR